MSISNVNTLSTKEVDVKNITSRYILDKADPLNARVTLLEAKLNETINILNEVVDDIND